MRIFRVLETAGAALWVGGQFFGVFFLPAAAGVLPRWRDRRRVIGEGWHAWTPMSFAALGATALGSAMNLAMAQSDSEKKRASLRLAAAITGLTSTAAGTLLGAAMKRQVDGKDAAIVRNEDGLPVVYLARRPALRKSMIPVNVMHTISALGLVVTPP